MSQELILTKTIKDPSEQNFWMLKCRQLNNSPLYTSSWIDNGEDMSYVYNSHYKTLSWCYWSHKKAIRELKYPTNPHKSKCKKTLLYNIDCFNGPSDAVKDLIDTNTWWSID